MERSVFEQLVEEGITRIPAAFREHIQNVAILVEDAPEAQTVREQELDPEQDTLLGLYQGVPHTERGPEYGVGETLPDTITIYQTPTEEMADGDHEAVRRIVADTVWHEVAHHFGLDEDAVHARERQRGVNTGGNPRNA